MDIWVTGIVMAGLGYWAAHIRLTSRRIQAHQHLQTAKDILGVVKAVDQAERATPTDRSKEDKHERV